MSMMMVIMVAADGASDTVSVSIVKVNNNDNGNEAYTATTRSSSSSVSSSTANGAVQAAIAKMDETSYSIPKWTSSSGLGVDQMENTDNEGPQVVAAVAVDTGHNNTVSSNVLDIVNQVAIATRQRHSKLSKLGQPSTTNESMKSTKSTKSSGKVPPLQEEAPVEAPTIDPPDIIPISPIEAPVATPDNIPVSPIEAPVEAPIELVAPITTTTAAPVSAPEELGVDAPTDTPFVPTTDAPVVPPTLQPTGPQFVPILPPGPTAQPPTLRPTSSPTNSPTIQPTNSPTLQPTNSPTLQPTNSPTNSPTLQPTNSPTNSPTLQPTNSPTNSPTLQPTVRFAPQFLPVLPPGSTARPTTLRPTNSPTRTPTVRPTNTPTKIPTQRPTVMPTPVEVPVNNDEDNDDNEEDCIVPVFAPIVYGLQPDCGTNDPNGYNICLNLTSSSGTITTAFATYGKARERWESIIVGDIASRTVNSQPITSSVPIFVDDILISATEIRMDGRGGILGSAGPRLVRGSGPSNEQWLPMTGIMEFDVDDIAWLVSTKRWEAVITHEMAHVIGIGTLWQPKGLLNTGSGSSSSTRYTGINANREYSALGGGSSSTTVPIEQDGGAGTSGAHWDEDCMDTEIMTGFVDAGQLNPVSKVTIGAMEDLGYEVNYACADSYSIPSPRPARCAFGGDSNIADGETETSPSTKPPLTDENLAKAIEYGQSILNGAHDGRVDDGGVDGDDSVVQLYDKIIVLFMQDEVIYDVVVTAL
jgi:hypothetical protein